jgi:hypothetical protein
MEHYKFVEGETKLWRSLVELMLHDLGSKDLQIREEAEEWLCPLNRDFLFVCDLASLDPEKILEFIESNKSILQSTDNLKKKVRSLKKKYGEE